ncbi:putative porin [Christiangramia sp. SM2212]|uniref:Porin n=1 Tax=Christiangramia sediminicola TaxID=3073267 RepID=A0ABU1EUC3_9FLAO|nr:putative porin [Christiangramia sp. SM2212]MDR5591990.1 putative porin [Christiangramia sp. SM2212]
MRKILFCLFILCSFQSWSQAPGESQRIDASKKKDSMPPIEDYKIISVKNDTVHLDTTLTILKDYNFNYLRKDNFELLSFSNTGQPYNSLSLDRKYKNAFPEFGARAKHFNFFEVEDVNYYHVPTPMTDLYFKTVPEQGQQLDALFTVNTSKNFNLFIGYKGTRALGRYQNIKTSAGNLRLGFSYDSDNAKYHAKAHFASQDLANEENGGLDSLSVEQYIAREEEFDDRSVLSVNFENAENTLYGKRFFLDHEYILTRVTDSTNMLSISHEFDYSYKKYVYDQESAVNDIFGESFESSNLRDETRMKRLFNEVSANYANKILGKLSFGAGYTKYDYGYNSVFIKPGDTIGNRLNGGVLHIAGAYNKKIGGFALNAEGRLNLSDEFSGNYLEARASYSFNKDNSILFGLNQNSSAPNFNFLLYQSDYLNYNWQNDFDNEISQKLFADFRSKKLFDVSGSLEQIENYTYFSTDENGFVKPFQAGSQVRYLKLRAEKEIDLGLFGAYNTIMYQNVFEGLDVLNLPEFVTRNSIYYKDFWFDEALYLQTGFTFKYFSKYEMNDYDPVLAEFYVQNSQELGGYPVVDYFFNAKVDKARIFFKLENLNDLIEQNNNFSAPGYPYTDFLVRFGLVWNLFL